VTDTALTTWRGHRLRRFHANCWLADRHQSLADHSWGVTALIVMLHPRPSTTLLAYALMHDAGEHAAGDVPYPAKMASEALRAAVTAVEAQALADLLPDWMSSLRPSEEDRRWIKMADGLEAILWAAHHGALARGEGWSEQIDAVKSLAKVLGVSVRVAKLIKEAQA